MEDQVDLSAEGGFQCPIKIGKKVVSPASPLYAGPKGQVEPQVGVSYKENSGSSGGHGLV
jgi:hypothetical protein